MERFDDDDDNDEWVGRVGKKEEGRGNSWPGGSSCEAFYDGTPIFFSSADQKKKEKATQSSADFIFFSFSFQIDFPCPPTFHFLPAFSYVIG